MAEAQLALQNPVGLAQEVALKSVINESSSVEMESMLVL
jgi:hypothetical protein